jgi:resuscitation-promoting factor RpfB
MLDQPISGRKTGSEPAGAPERYVWSAVAWLLALSALIAGGWWVVRQTPLIGVPVTVRVDGHSETVRSAQADVAGLLAELGLSLRPEDALAPARSTPLTANLVVTVQRARPGLVSSDGRLVEVFTRAETVGGLLKAAGIAVSEQDEVLLDGAPTGHDTRLPLVKRAAPARGFPGGRSWEVPLPAPAHLSIHRAVPITVNDGSVPYTLYTTAATIGEALLREDVTLYLGDEVQPGLGTRVSAGMRVEIGRSRPLVVAADGRTAQTRTKGETVGAALMDLGIVVAGMDEVTPALHEELVDHMTVKVTRVSEVTLVESTAIPFESISAPDDNLEIDTTRLAQAGQNGEYRKRYKVRYEDGQEIRRDLVDDWQAAAPVRRVTSYGRMIVPRTVDTEYGPLTYWRKIRMYATAYSPARSGTPKSAPWYGRTRIGMPLKKGLVAIDPKVIPFHTPLYIPGYGKALAADIGGGVRGKWIDLGYEDHDYQAWHWWVDVYVLEPRPARGKILWVLPNYPPPGFPKNR